MEGKWDKLKNNVPWMDGEKVDATVREAIPGATLLSSFADSRTYKVQRSAVSIADVTTSVILP